MNYDIHASNQVFRELFEAGPHPMWIFDTETLMFLAVNDAAIAKYGYSRGEFLKMSTVDIRPAEEAERYRAHLGNQANEVDRAGRWRHRSRDGTILHVDITARKIRFEGHSAEIVMAIDMSEHVDALVRLQAAETMYRGLIEHSMVGLYIVKGSKIVYANPRVAGMFGYAPDELVNKDLFDLVDPAERDTVRAAIRERLASPVASGHRSFTGRRRDGSTIIVDVQNTRTGLPGETTMMGVVLDVTEEKLADQRTQKYLAHIERLLDDTLHTISTMGEIRDAYTAGHESRVGNLAAAIGAELGMETAKLQTLRTVGLVHDAGKIGVPLEILTKPTRLKPPEFELIKTHAQTGYDILQAIDFRQPVAEAVLQH
ncbi:MAG: PAS domain S-box protein, partial [Burkholderiales bacterium]